MFLQATGELSNLTSQPVSPPSGVGLLNSEHSHAEMAVIIFGDSVDFSEDKYQNKSSWIQFEGSDGTNDFIKHTTGVTLGYLFETLGLGLDDQCFVFQDGRSFCTDENYSLRFFVNDKQVDSVIDYETVEK